MRVAIRVDASPLIGGGHAMRCLALADALAERGAEVHFVSAATTDEVAQRIEAAGYLLSLIARPPELNRGDHDWHAHPLGSEAQAIDVQATQAAVGSVDWLIVDHYLLDSRWHSAGRRFARRLLVIDDLANREYVCDLLLDQTYGRAPTDYEGLVPDRATILAGSAYAVLRPEFEHERQEAIDRRKKSTKVERILISMGTSDIGGATAAILEKVLASAPDRRVDVVLGPLSPSLGKVRALAQGSKNVRLLIDSREIAVLMREADLAIGAAGTTSLERCCLGLPAIALVVAENQRTSADGLAEAGAIIAVEDLESLQSTLELLIDDPDRLAQMSAAGFAICDGGGIERVLATMLGKPHLMSGSVNLRPATIADAEKMWLWRNDPVARVQSRNTDPIAWDIHRQWFATALDEPGRKLLIAECGGELFGNVSFRPEEDGSEISIAVDRNQRSVGLGKALLTAALDHAPAGPIYASVRADNVPSRRLFEACAFQSVESDELGFVRYCRFNEPRRRKLA